VTYLGKKSHHQSSILNQLLKHHQEEWQSSSVDDGIIALNVRSVDGDDAKELLFCRLDAKHRLNNGRVNTATLSRYKNTESGGFWISGLNPHNNWQVWDWGRYKPDVPFISQKDNKLIKYLSPPNGGSHPIYLDVPNYIWDKVAKHYRINRYHSPLVERLANNHLTNDSGSYSLTPIGLRQSLSDCLQEGIEPVTFLPNALQSKPEVTSESSDPYCFWSWVKQHPEIPIVLTEGEKKAACLLSLGFVAISLPGIWMGRVKNKETGEDYLHPDLLPMVGEGRKFVILFDNDQKPSTRRTVNKAIEYTGKVIEKSGASCEVAFLPDDSPKGVDDFVTANGGESAISLITEIIEAALTFDQFLRQSCPKSWGLSSKYPANVKLNTPYLSDNLRLPDSGLVALWSGMGTGKTELLAQLRSSFPKERFLNIGHRVNLLHNLSERLSTPIYSEISLGQLGKTDSLSITLDSLYKIQTQFNEYGCVFLDEACQNLAHLLHSNTCKEHRGAILEVLEYIIGKAKLVVLADAHMDDVTVDFFREMRPAGEVPFIIHNEYRQKGREVNLYHGKDSSALVAQIATALILKLKIMVVSDSKKFIKKLEATMNVQVQSDNCLFEADEHGDDNQLRIWSIHGDNSGSKENKAFIKDISNEVKNVDALLASPSLGTGVDIKGYHFDTVFGAFHATSQSATECAQSLHRYRHQVPLHIWIAPRPPFGYQETNATKIKETMLNSNKMTAFLIRVDKETGQRGAEKDWALDAYCQIEANRNRSINNLRDDLSNLLEEMGYELSVVSTETDSEAKTQFKQTGQQIDEAQRLAIVNANSINEQEYQARQTKDYLKPESEVECEKYRIQRAYGMTVTEDLVKRDKGGLLIRQIIALESMVAPSEGEIVDPNTGLKYPAPPQIVADKDLQEREHLPFCMDWHNYSSQWLARHILGLPKILARLLAGGDVCATDPDVVKMTDTAKASRVQIKALLNITIPKDCKPLWLMALLLNQLGLKTASRKRGGQGQQVIYSSLTIKETAFAIEVLKHRERIRQQKAEKEQQLLEQSQVHALQMQVQYGIEPVKPKISTPDHIGGIQTLERDVDISNEEPKDRVYPALHTWKALKPCLELLKDKSNIEESEIQQLTRGSKVSNRLSDIRLE